MTRPLSLLICVIAGLCLASMAKAAEFEFLTGAAAPRLESGRVAHQCNVRLSGEIVAGDAQRFEEFLVQIGPKIEKGDFDQGSPRIITLCLMSAGGSFQDAIKIAEFIRRDRSWTNQSTPFIRTRLEREAECLSACAIVFLSGTVRGVEDPAIIERSMHPTARLGFHAPSLSLISGQYNEQFVSTAYDNSIFGIAEILRILHLGQNSDGTFYSGDDSWISPSLLAEMLKTPSDSMRFLETVDDAGRWNIRVSPIEPVPVTRPALLNACENRRNWELDRSSSVQGYMTIVEQEPRPVSQYSDELELERFLFVIDEFFGTYCSVVRPSLKRFEIGFNFEGGGETPVRALELIAPETPLAQLAPKNEPPAPKLDLTSRTHWTAPDLRRPEDFIAAEASAIAQGSAWVKRYGGNRLYLFDHNGSKMAFERRERTLWVWYYQPRPGIAAAGVRPGTLLMYSRDTQDGEYFARRFSKTCGDIIYSVRRKRGGLAHVPTFEGQFQKRDSACVPSGIKDDVLTFTAID